MAPRRQRKGLSWFAAALIAALAVDAFAQTPEITKANNTDNLTLTTSWVGGVLPTSTNTIVFDSTFAGGTVVTNTSANYLTVYGIKLTNPGAGVTLSGANAALTMGIGAGGIDMSSATRDLTFTSNAVGRQLDLTTDQTWRIATGRTITIQTQGGLYVGSPSTSTPRSLEVTGGGTLRLTAVNLTSGTVTVNNATLYWDNNGAGGARALSSATVLNSGGLLWAEFARNPVPINGAITFNGGVLQATRPTNRTDWTTYDLAITGGVSVGGSGGTIRFFGAFADYGQSPTLSLTGSLSGTGALTVTNTTSVSGTTPGTPTVIFSGNNSNFAGTLDFQGATGSRLYRLAAATAGSGSATFTIASGNTVEVNAVSVAMGNLTGSGTLRNSASGTTGNAVVTVGALGRSGTFSGVIADGTSGNMAFTKTGSGTSTLSGASLFTGAVTAGNGVVRFNSVATGTGAQSLGAGSVVNLGVAGSTAGEIDYVGVTGALDKNVFALGTGRNRIRNSGAGTLTLSGTLTKNGTILELAGGTFAVSGQITGVAANSDLFINGATVTLTNTNNDYNGPTYVYGDGSLVLGANNVIPDGSALTLGGTGGDTGSGSITTGTFTDTIASLTTSSLGATVGISVSGTTAGGLTMGGLTFGAGTDTLAVSLASPTLGRYTLLSYTSRSGTFDAVTGSGDYNVVYGGAGTGTVDLQMKAGQSFTLTPATSRVLVGGSTSLSGVLVNTSPADSAALGVDLSSTGALTATNLASSSGATIAAGGTSTITATLLAGPTAGTQSWSVVNTDFGAITTTSTASGTITAYDAAIASFTSGSATSSWFVDIGSFDQDTGPHVASFDIYNLLTDLLYTADLRLMSVTALGTPSDSLAINLTPGSFGDLAAGDFSQWVATLFTDAVGSFTNTYQLDFVSAKDGTALGGPQSMTLTVTGMVFMAVPEPGALALAGIGLAVGGRLLRRRRRSAA